VAMGHGKDDQDMAARKQKTTGKRAAGAKAAKQQAAKKNAPAMKAAGKRAPAKGKAAPASARGRATKPAPRPAASTAKRTGLLNIDYSLCRGCSGCADTFPRLFEMRGDLAWVITAEAFDPVRDSGVLTVCPYYAISLE
jgi:hypothetical protein